MKNSSMCGLKRWSTVVIPCVYKAETSTAHHLFMLQGYITPIQLSTPPPPAPFNSQSPLPLTSSQNKTSPVKINAQLA